MPRRDPEQSALVYVASSDDHDRDCPTPWPTIHTWRPQVTRYARRHGMALVRLTRQSAMVATAVTVGVVQEAGRATAAARLRVSVSSPVSRGAAARTVGTAAGLLRTERAAGGHACIRLLLPVGRRSPVRLWALHQRSLWRLLRREPVQTRRGVRALAGRRHVLAGHAQQPAAAAAGSSVTAAEPGAHADAAAALRAAAADSAGAVVRPVRVGASDVCRSHQSISRSGPRRAHRPGREQRAL
jgi:hypothetical protein